MSDNVALNSEELESVQSAFSQASAGGLLREAREAEGLHISVLAASLKVPAKKLEALEADRFDELTDIVFARALAASVCRTLKMDSTPVLALLPQTTQHNLKTDESGINAPFRTSGDRGGVLFLSQLKKPIVLSILVLLCGAVFIVFFPITRHNNIADLPRSDSANELALNPSFITAPSVSESLPAAGLDSILPVNPSSLLPPASTPGTGLQVTPSIIPGSTATSDVIVFTARGSSWIEVVDSKGAVQVRKTMVSGEVISASGVMPLAVVVGRADTTDVQVHGRPMDLAPIAKDNVARFEVK